MKIHHRALKFVDRKYEAQGSDQWHEKRKRKVTCSDIAAILGENKYESQAKVFLKKTGQEVRSGNFMTQYGTNTEATVADKYAAKVGEECLEVGFINHPEHNWFGGSPDRIALKSGKLVEIKCVVTRQIEPGYVPPMYLCQVQGLMEVCDLEECDVVQYRQETMFADELLDITTVQRDREWFKEALPKLKAFSDRLNDWFTKSDARKALGRQLLVLAILSKAEKISEEQRASIAGIAAEYRKLTEELNSQPKKQPRAPRKRKVTEEEFDNSECMISGDS